MTLFRVGLTILCRFVVWWLIVSIVWTVYPVPADRNSCEGLHVIDHNYPPQTKAGFVS